MSIRRRAIRIFWILGGLLLILAVRIRGGSGGAQADGGILVAQTGVISTSGSDNRAGRRVVADEPRDRFPVTIRRPSGTPLIELKQPDPLGRVGRVTCSTCHSIRAPILQKRSPADLTQFHQAMPLEHGELACYACHNPENSDTLRLADGSVVEYADVMNLCAQCHGFKAQDYARGLHGGMTGFWDLSRGGRVRNNCIDCHDPHVPQYPKMQPTFKPRDRFLAPPAHGDRHPSHDTNAREVDLE
jgi:hypothetical protein